MWIDKEIMNKRKTEEEIMSCYHISAATIRRILNYKSTLRRNYDINIWSYSKWLSSEALINCIESYTELTMHPFWWKDLIMHIKIKMNVQLKPNILRQILQKRFYKSYKRGSARPTKIDDKKHKWMNSLFWTKLIHTLPSVKRVINIDGWWLSRSIKQNYSWLSRGKSCKIFNTKYTGSMSILSAIFSEGMSFTSAYHSTVNSDVFEQFPENLLRFIERIDPQTTSNTLLIMDNVPYQKTKRIKMMLADWRVKVFYLVPYSPELAPIELLFRSLKAKLRRCWDQSEISLTSQIGLEVVHQSLKQIRSEKMLRYWKNFYNEIRNYLDFININS